MKTLEESDRRHVRAAEGWLDLGNWEEGRKELACINRDASEHPEVLRVCLRFLVAVQEWEELARGATSLCAAEPGVVHGWVYLAGALDRLKRTSEARAILLKVVDKFPGAFPVYYGLASFSCRLGRMDEARKWWKMAAATGGSKVREMALEDPDLRELWEAGVD